MSAIKPSVVLIIDRSGSMGAVDSQGQTQLEVVQSDNNMFLTIMQNRGTLDNNLGQVGVVDFQTAAEQLFALQDLNASRTVQGKAIQAINGLSPAGLTNIKDAITTAHGMLANLGSGYTPAMILFSDGMWNRGGDPTSGLPTDIRIYSIGYGSSTYLSYLGTIASNTKGIYQHTNDDHMGVLSTIYNSIVGSTGIGSVISNAPHTLTAGMGHSVQVDVGASTGTTFAVNWNDSSVSANYNQPTHGQVTVQVFGPSGVINPDSNSTPASEGYSVLGFSGLSAGSYNLSATYYAPATANDTTSTSGLSLPTAFAAFGPHDNLSVEIATTESPRNLEVIVTDEGQPVEGAVINAYTIRRIHSDEELLERHHREIQRIIDEHQFDEDANPQSAALKLLANELGPSNIFFSHIKQLAQVVGHSSEGSYRLDIGPKKDGVAHNTYVEVRAVSPVTRDRFQRTAMFSH